MDEKIYNKLVRDKIPQIIELSGKQAIIEEVSGQEYLELLNAKLGEELQEYLDSQKSQGDVLSATLNVSKQNVPLVTYSWSMQTNSLLCGGLQIMINQLRITLKWTLLWAVRNLYFMLWNKRRRQI